jgi:1-acyl-sn-glycerol-3-phosphate acyltransferase
MARKLNIVPVDADANLVKAMQAGAYGLRRGKTLVLFPEGERAIDGEPGRFKRGATILASRLEVPIVPAAFDGLFHVWPRSRPFNWRALLPWSGVRVTLRFGPALQPAQLLTDAGTLSDEHATSVLLARVKALLADIRQQRRA